MKVLICLVVCACAAAASAREVPPSPLLETTAFDYHRRFGIPQAERIRKLEEQAARDPSRIVGGAPSSLGQHPFTAGLLAEFLNADGQGLCGGVLVTGIRLLTAAHCWWDGRTQTWRFEVVLGSVTLFTGGTRVHSSSVVTHPDWSPILTRNDIAVIFLADSVIGEDPNIRAVALPRGMSDQFTGELGTVVGFGLKEDGGSVEPTQYKSYVTVAVITNTLCSLSYPISVQESNICTSGAGGSGTCQGDSGGPLVAQRGGQTLLIGISSWVSALGCAVGNPAAFARITSFMPWIDSHIL